MMRIHKTFYLLVLIAAISFLSALLNPISAQYSLPSTDINFTLDYSKENLFQQFMNIKEPFVLTISSKDTYMPTLGTFCLIEEEFTKSANMPIRIRLGSVDYVDKLENKSN